MDKKVCVIGAGICGLVSIKACLESNLQVICYEKTEEVGGLWRYREETVPGVGSVTRTTVSITSKEMSALSDFPPAKDAANYMDHNSVLAYYEDYMEQFKLREHIRFSQEVIQVQKSIDFENNGQWLVTVQQKNGRNQDITYDFVMICTGGFVHPCVPQFPGLDMFKGRVLHASSYKDYPGFEDQKILVVGIGASATNIASELARVGRALPILLSSRSGAWLIPRLAEGGLPWDILYARRYLNILFSKIMPRSFTCDYFENKANQKMDHKLYKIQPNYRITDQNSVVDDDLTMRLICGSVVVKGEIDHFTSHGVIFKGDDDKEWQVSVVILATGYELKIPCIEESILQLQRNRVELYQYVFPITLSQPTLAVIGQVQPNGAIAPVAEMQARWVTRTFAGHCHVPPQKHMQSEVHAYNNVRRRNPYETDWFHYMDTLAGYIGAKPQLKKMLIKDPRLFYACFFGPGAPYQFRLNGPNSWPKARETMLTVNNRVLQPLRSRRSNIRIHRTPFIEVCVAILVTMVVIYFLLF